MTDNNIKIHKVKLLKGGERLALIIKESGIVKSNDMKECENPVHPDLSSAVQALAVHLAILTDFIEPQQSSDTEELEKFTVTGYSRKEKQGVEGIVITGMRKTKTGQKFTINSPFTTFNTEGDEAYLLVNDLLSKMDTIDSEVRKYLFEGKMLQPSLFDAGASDDDDEDDDDRTKTTINVLHPESQQEKDEKVLQHLRSGVGHANAEAMERVADMDGEDKAGVNSAIDGAVGAMVEEQREIMRGRGKRKRK